ncbi:hypothetical protein AURDEDRAFT_139537 [Auricularia subglabra TFB-10046 SS5]|nr:hypothetical protein AURDEDRAFT_139537 [Auricularia subglabra TFB-10046 SS5]
MDLRAEPTTLNIQRRDQRQHECHPCARGRLGVRNDPTLRRLYVLVHDRVAPPVNVHLLVLHTASPAYNPAQTAQRRDPGTRVVSNGQPSPPLSRAHYITHTVSHMDSLAGVALRYGVSVATLRRANGLWASDSIHLRAALVIPDGWELLPKTTHARARTLSLDREAPSESDAEHELLPLLLSAHRRKSHPQLSMTTTNEQPSPIRGMVLPRAGE